MTRETILIVEDDRVHATYLQQILMELAYRVINKPLHAQREITNKESVIRFVDHGI